MVISKLLYTILLENSYYENLDNIFCYKPDLIMTNQNSIFGNGMEDIGSIKY